MHSNQLTRDQDYVFQSIRSETMQPEKESQSGAQKATAFAMDLGVPPATESKDSSLSGIESV